MQTPRSLPMHIGMAEKAGTPLSWADLMQAVEWADVIIIGEQHDDEMGHFFQQAVVEDVFARWPRSAVSMEMLERDEQGLTDDYLEGIIDQATFVRMTHSESWGGPDKKWDTWYQPMIDAAKNSPGARVVAANAPRRYVRLARLEGYERLRALPPERRAFFDLHVSPMDSPYRERFIDLMMGMGDHSTGDKAETQTPEQLRARREQLKSSFRSQFLWDSTMAASIARAKPSRDRKVVHMIGQFHSDFEGGTVRELRARMPGVRILNISMQRVGPQPLREDDIGRADVIVYTGERPRREEPSEEQED